MPRDWSTRPWEVGLPELMHTLSAALQALCPQLSLSAFSTLTSPLLWPHFRNAKWVGLASGDLCHTAALPLSELQKASLHLDSAIEYPSVRRGSQKRPENFCQKAFQSPLRRGRMHESPPPAVPPAPTVLPSCGARQLCLLLSPQATRITRSPTRHHICWSSADITAKEH